MAGDSPQGEADDNAMPGVPAGATGFEGPSVDGDTQNRWEGPGPK